MVLFQLVNIFTNFFLLSNYVRVHSLQSMVALVLVFFISFFCSYILYLTFISCSTPVLFPKPRIFFCTRCFFENPKVRVFANFGDRFLQTFLRDVANKCHHSLMRLLSIFLEEANDLCSVCRCFLCKFTFLYQLYSSIYQRFSVFVKREYLGCLRTVFVEAAKKN